MRPKKEKIPKTMSFDKVHFRYLQALAPQHFMKQDGAIALAADAHPVLVQYYESIQWRALEAIHGVFDETCTLDQVEDRIAKKKEEMGIEYPTKDIDEYDDDPYGDEYWE